MVYLPLQVMIWLNDDESDPPFTQFAVKDPMEGALL